jgi:hypothetical protein
MPEYLHLSYFSLNFLIIFGLAALMLSLLPDRDNIYLVVLIFYGFLCLIFLPSLMKAIILPIILKLGNNLSDKFS